MIRILGFLPGKVGLYELAFIHKSASLSDSKGNPLNYERLEYLGDAVLGVIIAEFLYRQFPDRNEGFLTKMRSKIVNGDNLSMLTQQMGLSQLLDNRIQNEQANRHILGDAFEALIGAIYLDKGYRRTRRFVLRRVIRKHIDLIELERNETNFKSQLIEWAQKNRKEITFYTDIEPYDPTLFISFVGIGDTLFGSGTGASKKEAEQNAALETLKELKV
ncbi:MAG: ribonuclease III [Bacteroidia bacterium]|nr:ribonuclease III [Bacteroidia bacterium]